MPFDTPAGPAVLVANLVNLEGLAERLGVHTNTVYNWIKRAEKIGFPDPMPVSEYVYDYAEVYDWFREWVKKNQRFYPMAALEILTERPAE